MDFRSRFAGQHVLITGAARGLGLEIAHHFAREGAVLSLFDQDSANLEEARQKLQQTTKVQAYCLDISDAGAVKQAVTTAEQWQPLDVLVNNAGIAYETPFLAIEEKEWRKVLDVNLTGMFFVAQAVCRFMAARKRGVVINMSSKNGMDGEAGYAHYNASKAGAILLTKTMALELAHCGIRVNAVCPGYIQTPMSAAIDSPEFVENFVKQYIPAGRPGKPGEIAPVFLFLASAESSFINGQVIVADGGQLAGQNPGPEVLAKLKTIE